MGTYDYKYKGMRRIMYDAGETFIPLCEKCGRFVKADKTISPTNSATPTECNATCAKCGRTHMLFEGFSGVPA